jgi:hypothetical protein
MSALRAVPADGPASIQGEQQATHARHQVASQDYVDRYAREVSEGLAICRERFRHRYPPMPARKPFDDHPTVSYLLVRYTEPCLDCGCAIQVQRFEARFEGRGRNQVLRVRPAWNSTIYIKNELGEEYVQREHGFIRPRDFREARATDIVNSDPELQALAAAAARERAKLLQRREQAAAQRAQGPDQGES